MDIPFDGKVCPYCHADKSRDQHVQSLTATFGVIAFTLAYVTTWNVGVSVVAMLIGGIVGMALAFKNRPR